MAGTVSATIKINDAFSGALNKLKSGLGSSATAMNKLKSNTSASSSGGGMFKQFLGANVIGAGVTKAMGAIGNGVRSMYGELDESSRAWQTFNGNMKMIGQSPKQIASTRGDLQKFAQQTIYSASDMASTYSQLAAVGTKDTKSLVKGFGGLASASSDPQQAMKTLSQQATQAAAKPKIQWQDFKLMMEQTPAGMAAVAKTMHRSTGQLVKDVQDGKVKTNDFFAAIAKTGTNKNFSKMATQYKTVGQAMDGLKETLANKMQPAFDKVSKVGINAISGITDKIGNVNFDGLADGLLGLGPKIMAGLQPLKMVAPYVIAAVGAFAGISAISSILTSVSAGAEAAGMGLINFVTKIQAMPAQIVSVFSTIGSAFGALGTPIIIALAVVTVAVVAAVYAWQTNFAGIRDFMSSVFGNMGSIFAPLVSAFDELKSALAPVANVLLPMLGQALGMIGVGVIVSIAVAFAALADALRIVVSVGAAVVHAVMAIVQGMQALHQAMTGDFSGAASSLSKAKNSISGIGDALSHIGDKSATSQVLSSLDQLGSKASSTKSQLSNIQVKPKLDTSNVFSQMDQMTAGKTAKVNVKPEIQAGANPFATIQAQADSHPVKTKAQVDTTGVGNPLKQLQSQASANPIKAKVQADTSSTADPFQQIKSKAASTTIKPKVETPKVPTPTMPKGQTLHVKVATPKIPTPTRPASMPTLHVKVATPKIPTPTKPTMPTIAAPHVMRPSMAGVVSAVASGMRGAAAAARQGGAGISAAVRSSIAQAVGAARAGAGAMRSAGAMIGAGLAGGMRSQVGAVAAAANALVAQADRAARAAAKIHSPSRVFAEIGDYMGQGMAVGMNGTSSLVAGAGATMAHSAVGGARGATMPEFNPNASTPSHSPFVRGVASGSSTTNATTTNSNQRNGGTHVTFAAGAIQIQSTGNADYDGERIAAALESHLINLKERRG
ncbi:tape measure protein [Levilactobacillus wangkuiensis]|uniref:tape measure protein n=1 Tax=Levilactobacillus wangkuiensis TaxID=2799566 RepID=UPI001944CBD0|nr:tape measure protein [Levilactobacillus wangkuiensis]